MGNEDTKVYLGLDIGFGDVKIVAAFPTDGSEPPEGQRHHGRLFTKFPTAIASAKEGIIGDLGEAEEEYLFNGRKYLVGPPALQCREIFSTRDITFLITYAPLLVYRAIEHLSEKRAIPLVDLLNGKIRLCLGVPLAYFHERRTELLKALEDCRVSGNRITFESVDIRAQGQGILFDYMLDDSGIPLPARLNFNILIVDIGFNTVDILGVIQGRPSREWSDMLEGGGIVRISGEIQSHLTKNFGFSLPEQAVKDVLQKESISLYGVEKDLSDIIRTVSQGYADWLLQEISSRWDGFLKRADRMIVAGGGALYVRHHFLEKYPKGFLHLPERPEYANAFGFYKYLRAVRDDQSG